MVPSHPRVVPTIAGASPLRPAGFRVLIPGFAQWGWRQRERALVLFGMFATAVAVAIFAWGSKPGAAMLVCAFVMHVASTADVIRQASFPGFGPWVPTVSAAFGLGLGCYGPMLIVASALAWPDQSAGPSPDSYLVNRWAFRQVEPRTGDWVWFRTPHGFGIGQLVAGPGQEVECEQDVLRVEGQRLLWNSRSREKPHLDLTMTVPNDRYLIVPLVEKSGTTTAAGLVLVAREDVVGRPWAQIYPVRKRGFLF